MGWSRAVTAGAAPLALAASLLAAAAPAYADRPVKEAFHDTMAPFEVSDVCGFSITVVSHQRGFEINSPHGTRSTVNLTEQAVFTTNGATLRSRPFTFTIHFLRD